jgi:5-methyltetrahydrofolate--homocysteine methyltransferase
MADLGALKDLIIAGKRKDAEAMTRVLLDGGMDPVKMIQEALIPAMGVVGDKFKNGEYFVPEMLISAKAMKQSMEVIKPKLVAGTYKPVGKVVIGTVRGDLHDIGKNLVKMMLEGAGFEVIDLGVDVAPEKFVAAAKEQNAQLVAMSALLTTTMLSMPDTIKALEASGLRGKVKVMIGGAATTEAFAKEIKADGYGADASTAVSLAKQLVGVK